MRSTSRRLALLAAAGMLAVLAPIGANADPSWCTSNIVIFSSPANLNSNALVCDAAGPDTAPYDGRLINPGSTGIYLRYIIDQGATVPSLTAHVTGLGLDQDIVLTRQEFHFIPQNPVSLGYTYDSVVVSIDPAATGCITASIASVDDSTTFHTVGTLACA
ncbi:MAG: hypothetical protein ABR579_07375 [Actinomycetota bacterium]